MVAPSEERSTTGHSLSLDKPLRMEEIEENIYSCSGFPADCVLLGIGHLLKNNRPDLVVTGINKGANLGQDFYYSGTMAAAREACFHKIKSISSSLVLGKNMKEFHYETGAKIISLLIEHGITDVISEGVLLNLNFPNLPFEKIKAIKQTTIGFRKYSEAVHERQDTRERSYYWIAGQYSGFLDESESDCVAVDQSFVAITPHSIRGEDYKHRRELDELLQKINNIYFN
jgi:5'-nucleotidase